MITSRLLAGSIAVLALAATAACTKNDEASWPTKPVRLIVPFPAGGSTDVVARLIAERLGQKLGQQFVVDNRPGAAGNIGTDQVAKAAPDGYTLTLTTSGPLVNNKYLYKSMPFDPAKDLTPIVLVGEIPLVIVSTDKVPAKNLKEFIALAKAAPGKYSIGNPGNGTIGHLAYELLRHNTGTQFLGVPYKGDVPAMADLMGGSIQAISAPITAFIPQIQAGKMTGLAVTSKKRFPQLPDLPTAIEQGFDVEAAVWFAVAGPAGLPRPIVDKLNREINLVLDSPEGRSKLEQFGALVGGGSPEQLDTLMKGESEKWKRIIEQANIKLD
ncbi:Tripartite tricarboxylate transporter family receptor [Pigmentiphaga humi]|uniref:Tripartite tricarboxylate transporter family receptor n=1 Tax=Pigmentiphaga humi TaxID=2478468 RepID=A0A3P4B4L3_9BURK|nr:tripartite tricarboxylate transporter substrate binding protein [Pigmentiphaga humi]VCU70466.1 Tripartite tricarboxylate transporter family receptor [Pigmentiphaga humi]